MAKQYTVWYNVVETWKVSFEAESLEEARSFVRQVRDGDESVEWLHEAHNGWEKNKGIDLEIEPLAVEED